MAQADFATRYAAHTAQKQLDDLCSQMERMSAESSSGPVENIVAMDKRIDALISTVGTLAYLTSRLAEKSA
jgi:hypothetical protein